MPSAKLFRQRVDWQRKASGQDSRGGALPVWSTRQAGMACSVQPKSAIAIELAARMGSQVTHTVYFDGTPAVEANDRLKVVGESPDRYLVVIGAARDMAGMGRVTAVDCLEVRS
jgi:head-tail adaptor